MNPIILLEEHTANKIAAGEVIERPASVVKELVENSLDAGASTIDVEIREGGKEYIRVVDNGRGIPQDEVPLAFERHATSKIRQVEDLFHIITLGFRGEALPSIAAVSELELITKTEPAHTGTLIAYEGGTRKKLEVVGAPDGTAITVRQLFFNTPARYKFLNQAASERRYVFDILTRIALANPAIAMRLVSDGEEIFATPGDGRLETVMLAIYGSRIGRNLVPVHAESKYLTISGLVCRPDVHRGNRQGQTFIVNRRVIASSLMASAVEKGYQTLLPRRRFPIAAISMTMEPSRIDVNVHPAKREIRFSDSSEVYKQVMLAVRRALQSQVPFAPWQPKELENTKSAPLPKSQQTKLSMETGRPHTYYPSREGDRSPEPNGQQAPTTPREASRLQSTDETSETKWGTLTGYSPEVAAPYKPPSPEVKGENVIWESTPSSWPQSSWRVLGQYQNTYITVDADDELWLIDQHVAHERVLYERFRKQLASSVAQSQAYLVPIHLEMSVTQVARLQEWAPRLASLGFEIEEFGTKDCLVRAVPTELSQISHDELSQLLLGIMENRETDDYYEAALVLMSCKGAVKAGESLATPVMEQLIKNLLATANPFTCPHGRPIIVRLALEDIHRRFGRS